MTKPRPVETLAPRDRFLARLRRNAAIGSLVVLLWLAFGAGTYFECTEEKDHTLIDAIRHAAMLVSGMGPTAGMKSQGCKLFDAFYALVSAFGVLAIAGFMFAPWFHRILHRYHLEDGRPDQ